MPSITRKYRDRMTGLEVWHTTSDPDASPPVSGLLRIDSPSRLQASAGADEVTLRTTPRTSGESWVKTSAAPDTPPPPPRARRGSSDERWALAAHEAAHAVAAVLLGIEVTDIAMSNEGGLTRVGELVDESPGGLAKRMAVVASGPLVGSRLGGPSTDAFSDQIGLVNLQARFETLYPDLPKPDPQALARAALSHPGAGQALAQLTGRLYDRRYLTGIEVMEIVLPHLGGRDARPTLQAALLNP